MTGFAGVDSLWGSVYALKGIGLWQTWIRPEHTCFDRLYSDVTTEELYAACLVELYAYAANEISWIESHNNIAVDFLGLQVDFSTYGKDTRASVSCSVFNLPLLSKRFGFSIQDISAWVIEEFKEFSIGGAYPLSKLWKFTSLAKSIVGYINKANKTNEIKRYWKEAFEEDIETTYQLSEGSASVITKLSDQFNKKLVASDF